jgi:tRNA (cmo5U34)-methyltransferase
MESTASQYFGSLVTEYDSLLRRAVPRYDEMIARVVEYLPSEGSRILELGCGTGNLTLAVAKRFPDAALTLVDASGEMLAVTRDRLAPDAQVTSLEATFEELPVEAGSFDLITSCIALHHVRDKADLFGRLHAALAPGGSLVFADQMAGVSDPHSAINWNRMVEFWRQPGHLDEAECRSLEEHSEAHDHYTGIVEQIRLLEAAGFADVDCVWRNWMWGILTACA